MLQTLLVDLELWLTETQATIASEIKLTSVKVVKDQIRASQVSNVKTIPGKSNWMYSIN